MQTITATSLAIWKVKIAEFDKLEFLGLKKQDIAVAGAVNP